MEQIENRMLRERMMESSKDDEMAKLNGPGWRSFTDGIFVPDESAFDYAIDHCTKVVPTGLHKIDWTKEFREMLVEWFYSGREWVREAGNGAD